ncbi:DMT family transporter [Rhodobacteraceae bacterium]|nr:DMT family transporter [Paracoccaceae bacterium]
MVVVLGLVWGGTFPVIELALTEFTPFWLAAGRIGFAAVLTLAIWQAMGGKLFDTAPSTSVKLNLVAIGAMSTALPFMLLSWGQNYVTAGFAGVSMASVALIVLPLAHLLIPGETMTRRKTIGFIIGFLGVAVLIGPQAFSSSGAAGELQGRLACLTAAACYAVSSVTMRRLPAMDPVGLSAITLLIGAVIVVTAALLVEGLPVSPTPRGWFLIALLGLIPTAAANLLRVLVIRSAGPTFMSLTNYQVPLWSVALGVLFLGEPFRMSLLAAMVLILIGVALSQWGALRQIFAGRKGA